MSSLLIDWLLHCFQLINPRGHKLECSYYSPVIRPKKLPCVVYCHGISHLLSRHDDLSSSLNEVVSIVSSGNCGCRLSAIETLKCLLPLNITVVAFDFSGSGLSEGEYVSLGYYEKDDLATVVQHLREGGLVTRIGIHIISVFCIGLQFSVQYYHTFIFWTL
jgi:hypothetical protein